MSTEVTVTTTLDFSTESWTRETLQMQENAARDLYLELRAIGLDIDRACLAVTFTKDKHNGFHYATMARVGHQSVESFRRRARTVTSQDQAVCFARCAGVRLAAEQIGDIDVDR